jgi:hypothetical protein
MMNKGKKIVDKVKEKLGKIFDDVAGALSPQPELIPIPVRNPQGRRPQPRQNRSPW